MKKIEFSKLILLVVYLTTVLFSLATVIVAILGQDASSIANIVLAMWGSVSMAISFYFWKAKAENIVKISKEIPNKVLDKIQDIGDFLE